MKEFSHYSNNTVLWPQKKDYGTVFVYHEGKVLDKVPEYEFSKSNYPEEAVFQTFRDDNTFNERKNEYQREGRRLYEEFKKDLFEEFEVEKNPKKDLAFSMAWDRGHSAGFESVYNEFSELVELIK